MKKKTNEKKSELKKKTNNTAVPTEIRTWENGIRGSRLRQ